MADGITVSAWVNRTADTTWNMIISREVKGGPLRVFRAGRGERKGVVLHRRGWRALQKYQKQRRYSHWRVGSPRGDL